jgi:heme-degrading monooxygenase HmoA
MKAPIFASLAVATLAAGAHAQVPQVAAEVAGGPVAVIVNVRKPWYAPKALVVANMRDTIAQYESLPGLDYKAFSFARADDQFGGIYLWKDKAAAGRWFGPAWFERVQRERGAAGNVRYFDVPVAVDNQPSGTLPAEGDYVATLVTLPVPSGVDRARLVAEFRAAVPTYRQIPGLLRKYFIVTDDGRFGGIYFWHSQASAQAWFNPAWHARVQQSYGQAAILEWFDIPILLPSRLVDNRIEMAQP